MTTGSKRALVQKQITESISSIGLCNDQYFRHIYPVKTEQSGLSIFHSMFLTPDQMELSKPLSGLAGRYADAANIAFYFEKSLSAVGAELKHGSEEAE